MRPTRWMVACAFGAPLLTSSLAGVHASGHGKHGDDDQGEQFYKHHDREVMREWYDDRQSNLPPGLAKRDRLPPGLEKQLVRRGTLPFWAPKTAATLSRRARTPATSATC